MTLLHATLRRRISDRAVAGLALLTGVALMGLSVALTTGDRYLAEQVASCARAGAHASPHPCRSGSAAVVAADICLRERAPDRLAVVRLRCDADGHRLLDAEIEFLGVEPIEHKLPQVSGNAELLIGGDFLPPPPPPRRGPNTGGESRGGVSGSGPVGASPRPQTWTVQR